MTKDNLYTVAVWLARFKDIQSMAFHASPAKARVRSFNPSCCHLELFTYCAPTWMYSGMLPPFFALLQTNIRLHQRRSICDMNRDLCCQNRTLATYVHFSGWLRPSCFAFKGPPPFHVVMAFDLVLACTMYSDQNNRMPENVDRSPQVPSEAISLWSHDPTKIYFPWWIGIMPRVVCDGSCGVVWLGRIEVHCAALYRKGLGFVTVFILKWYTNKRPVTGGHWVQNLLPEWS